MLAPPSLDSLKLIREFVSRSIHVGLGIDIPDRRLDCRRTRTERYRRRGHQYRLDPFRDRSGPGADILPIRPSAAFITGHPAFRGLGGRNLPRPLVQALP